MQADMKNEIAMNHLSGAERECLMDDMKSFDGQMPCIGTFCYDAASSSLFNVVKRELRPVEVETSGREGIRYIAYPDTRTSCPAHSGRVVWSSDTFVVEVSRWAEPVQDELTTLLEEEFSLPYFEFVYDEHWDLGHGWSGDMPR